MTSFCGDREPSRSSVSRQGLRQVHKAGPWTARRRSASKGYYPQKNILSCRSTSNLTVGRICPSLRFHRSTSFNNKNNRPVRVTAGGQLDLTSVQDIVGKIAAPIITDPYMTPVDDASTKKSANGSLAITSCLAVYPCYLKNRQ